MSLPINYSIRNVFVRRSSAFLTALGIACTVAAFTGVLALREGLEQIYEVGGRENVAIYLRDGSTSEGESNMPRQTVEILIKERPEVVRNEQGQPLAAAECYLAVYMEKTIGGLTNVPLRGIQPMSLELQSSALEIVEGEWLTFGTDQVVVGQKAANRMKNCQVGDTLMLNATPFQVVGIFDDAGGVQASEIWGDVERMMEALDRPTFQRVVARVQPGTDFAAIQETLGSDPRTGALRVRSEKDYMSTQTSTLGSVFEIIAIFLTVVMGAAAMLGAVNTMLASVAARTHEIGVLLALGFSKGAVFLAFLGESAGIGILGGILGMAMVLPFHGVETGAMNFQTFTDVSFAFRVTPELLGIALCVAISLAIFGGTIPALLAARKKPVDALRH